MMDWENFPPVHDPEVRLVAYQRAKHADEEWWQIEKIKYKMNSGEELTESEKLMYGHSIYGSANPHNF